MARRLDHRGPDASAVFHDGPLGFAHCRLAVMDPRPESDQPMATPDGRFVLSYNGEIYNFRELRSELEETGQRFATDGDTEVVLRALAHWGASAISRFNGMFALSLWDEERQELLLARDRYGEKPLYWATTSDGLLFASEIKAMLVHPSLRAELDPQALREYLTFQNIFTDRTLFAGVRMLAPGTYMVVREGEAPVVTRYWEYAFQEPENEASPEEYLEELDRLFIAAVNRHLVADVPVSSYLSGGMDSGLITGLAASQIPMLRTFTVGFDLSSASGIELAFDERERAERMSYLFKTEHYEMVLKAGDMERVMPSLVWHLEDLRVGQSYPNFYAAQLAGKFGKVVLSGAGGDEFFGGYPWRYYRAAVNESFDEYVGKYYSFWQRLLPDDVTEKVLEPVWAEAGQVDTRDIFRSVFDTAPFTEVSQPEDYINHSLFFEAKTFLHGLLVVEDKLAMAHSLETRLPFLDNDLVDFAMSVPARLKLGNLGEVLRLNENEPGPKTERFYERTRDGKLLLRKVMARHVSDDAANRVKQGFSAPDATWFRGESIDYVRRRLLNSHAPIYEFLAEAPIRDLIHEHLQGKQNRRLLIWSLLCLDQWCETFIEGKEPGS